MAENLPYFKFFPADWLSDFNVRTMSPAERGIYIDLLAHDWSENGIPDDPEKLARAVGVDAGRMRDAWEVLQDRFRPHPTKEGHVTNHRLSKERQQIQRAQEKRSEAARHAAKARWEQEKKKDDDADRMPNAMRDAMRSQSDGMPPRSREKSESDAEGSTPSEGSSLRSSPSTGGASSDVENSDRGGEADESEAEAHGPDENPGASVRQETGAPEDPGDDGPSWGDFVAEAKELVRDNLWQGTDPPERSPPDWDMRREISVLSRWQDQGYELEALLGAMRLYDGPPMTLAAWERKGNRGRLNELVGIWRKREEHGPKQLGEILAEAS